MHPLFYLQSDSNTTYAALQGTFLINFESSMAHGLYVYSDNFRTAILVYYMRRIHKTKWICSDDVYVIKGHSK
jgi:hypothetical protein